MEIIKINDVEYISIQEISREIGVKYQTIYAKITNKKIPNRTIGNYMFYEYHLCKDIIKYYKIKKQIELKNKK